MRAILVASLTLLAVIGCAAPVSGNYTFVVTAEESDCPPAYMPPTDPEGTQTLLVDMDVPEIVLVGSPDEHCPLDEMDFRCAFSDLDEQVNYRDDGLDAVYTLDLTLSGTFSTSTEMSGLTSVASSCIGANCDSLEEAGIPACVMTWYWDAAIED